MTPSDFTEYALIQRPAIALFEALGWVTINAKNETYGPSGTLGRDNRAEVVLTSRLLPVLQRFNPDLPKEAFDQAIEELTRDRSRLSLAAANREVYDLVKNGVKVRFPDPEEEGERFETVRLIDWDSPTNNDFLLVSEFWIAGEMYTRRADLVGFVNGIPLLVMELKAAHKNLKAAFDGNLTDYKTTVPHFFWFNGFIILSNGSESKVGSVTADWGHFNDWKRINSEGEEGIISLETMIRGTCDPVRFLDLVENFALFMEAKGGLIKLVAKNHQYLGVGNALEALYNIRNREGRLGVFWHTQGSGKSVSMVFFSQKVLRKIPGNWTFVIITDRIELDDQIYKTFTATGAVTEAKAQAESSAHLRQLLTEDHRYVFSLIQKFRTEDGRPHPRLSERSDIIVITDEAHRSQYDTFALNMRNALPNASFIAFTGTPLIVEEEKTRQVFGDYISIYNFKQSADDRATVPLFYENRIPELQLTNQDLNEDMENLLEQAELDEAQERKLEREFAREYHLITRDDRLEKIAEDIVEHFTERGWLGKAMVVSIDKATAVKMYDKVKKFWTTKIDHLRHRLDNAGETEKEELTEKMAYMEGTDMAVVVSSSQNESEEMKKKGVDIVPHRRRMVKEDLDTKFKDPDDPFRMVFVCAMWMTGFDVPSCSTIYLDKPMRNHTLMQTIARANRVFKDKVNGLIVDYVGVFRSLQKALTIYGSDYGGGVKEGESPVQDKAELLEMLKKAVAETVLFCKEQGIDVEKAIKSRQFERVRLLDDAADAIVATDDSKKRFAHLAGLVNRIYRAILPDPAANDYFPFCGLFRAIQLKIESLRPEVDIDDVMAKVDALLDESIAAKGYIIQGQLAPNSTAHLVDLSRIDFDKLKEIFIKGRKRMEIEKLRGLINGALHRMVRLNKTRTDYLERFQRMIDEYNAGAVNVEEFFKRLLDFARELQEEDARAVKENLSEEELAIFDLITKPDMKLTKKEEQSVKRTAREVLETLKREKLVLDWRKSQTTRARVRVTVEEKLDELPEVFTPELYRQKCDAVYQHVFESYYGAGRGVYFGAAG